MSFTRSIIVSSAGVMCLVASYALAAPANDAALDHRGSFVQDKWGKCVRTKWDGENDPCAPAPAPAPEPVAAPAPPPPPAPEPVVELEQRTVYFDFDSASLDMESIGKLDHLVSIINDSKQIADVRIVGYTDQYGANDYNLKLSERRVKAVESYIDGRSRLNAEVEDIRGAGKAPAEADCAVIAKRVEKIACMRKERRVEVEFKYQK